MVFVFALKANLIKMVNVSTHQIAKKVFHGTESNVSQFHVAQVYPTLTAADVVKVQPTLVPPVLIGMVIDVYISLTSVQLA